MVGKECQSFRKRYFYKLKKKILFSTNKKSVKNWETQHTKFALKIEESSK
jgi:hypothetical protein